MSLTRGSRLAPHCIWHLRYSAQQQQHPLSRSVHLCFSHHPGELGGNVRLSGGEGFWRWRPLVRDTWLVHSELFGTQSWKWTVSAVVVIDLRFLGICWWTFAVQVEITVGVHQLLEEKSPGWTSWIIESSHWFAHTGEFRGFGPKHAWRLWSYSAERVLDTKWADCFEVARWSSITMFFRVLLLVFFTNVKLAL